MKPLLRKRHALLFFLALAAATLTLTACGSGEEAAPEATAPATTEAPAATADEAAATEAPATTEGAATTEAPAEPASLKVALDWFPNPDHVGLLYAEDNGYWEEEGLDVELKTPSDPSAGLKLVATNKFDLAIYYEGDMFFAAEQGLPVIAIGALIPNPLNSLIALGDSKVQGLDTIKGATIGDSGLPFNDATLTTMRAQLGLSEDDIKRINVGFNLVPALLTKKVDAVIGAYRNIEGIEVRLETGQDPVIVTLEELGVPPFDELVVVANKDRLASDSAYASAVERFLVGLAKGTEGAAADEAGAIEIVKADTDYKPEQVEEMVPATIALLESPSDLPTGCFDLDAWQAFGQWMADNDLLKEPIDATSVATNDYMSNC